MRKLGGILAIGLLALTACSAPVETSPAPSVSAKVEMTAPTETETITAAPIPAQTAPKETTVALSGEFGDPATDAAFLAGVKAGWEGVVPSDDALVSAAMLACDKYAAGIPRIEMGLIEGDSGQDIRNTDRLAVYAGRNYCIEYNPDND